MKILKVVNIFKKFYFLSHILTCNLITYLFKMYHTTDDVNNEHGAKSSSLPASQKIYDLSKSVRVWSDFLRPHLHPNSLYLLDEMLLQSGRAVVEGSQSNYGFLAGASVYQREDVEDGITDRIRLLAESCGSLQVI